MADKASHLADFFAAQKHIPGPISDVESPNAVHQADLLFLPHDRIEKYAWTIASRFQGAEPLTHTHLSQRLFRQSISVDH